MSYCWYNSCFPAGDPTVSNPSLLFYKGPNNKRKKTGSGASRLISDLESWKYNVNWIKTVLGIAGTDYPVFSSNILPITGFSCSGGQISAERQYHIYKISFNGNISYLQNILVRISYLQNWNVNPVLCHCPSARPAISSWYLRGSENWMSGWK